MNHPVEATVSDFEIPDWEVFYFIDIFPKPTDKGTPLFLRRKDSIGEPYAIGKIIPRFDANNPIWMRRFTHEATTLAWLPPHPNIIKLYSVYGDVPRPWTVIVILEYCAGGTLSSLSHHVTSIQRRIPEVFVWHVLCQTLIALKHLDRNNLCMVSGQLRLRPVEGDGYPDIVLAELGYCLSQNEQMKRLDFRMLGAWILHHMIEIDEVADDTNLYSQELRDFVYVLFGRGDVGEQRPLPAEIEHNLIPLAKKQAYGGDKITAKMPEWMITYFNELKSSRESPKILLDSDAESSAQVSAAPGSRKISTQSWWFT